MTTELASLIVSGFALIIAIATAAYAKRSNRIANESNEIARESNDLAKNSNRIAIESKGIADNALNIERGRREEELADRRSQQERANAELKRQQVIARDFARHYTGAGRHLLLRALVEFGDEGDISQDGLERWYRLPFKVKSTTDVPDHLDGLEEVGYITVDRSNPSSPTVAITELGRNALEAWDAQHSDNESWITGTVRGFRRITDD